MNKQNWLITAKRAKRLAVRFAQKGDTVNALNARILAITALSKARRLAKMI